MASGRLARASFLVEAGHLVVGGAGRRDLLYSRPRPVLLPGWAPEQEAWSPAPKQVRRCGREALALHFLRIKTDSDLLMGISARCLQCHTPVLYLSVFTKRDASVHILILLRSCTYQKNAKKKFLLIKKPA